MKKEEIEVVTEKTKVSTATEKDRKRLAKIDDKKRVQAQKDRERIVKKAAKPKSKLQKKFSGGKRKVAKTVQETMPYIKVCDNFIFQVDKEKYSKTYIFDDINYTSADTDEEERIMLAYGALLKGFDSTFDIQITIHNNRINEKSFRERVFIKPSNDGYDKYRNEYNGMLKSQVVDEQNGGKGIICRKYLTITANAISVETARQKFKSAETHIRMAFQKIGTRVETLNANERVRILADIFRGADKEIFEISESEFLRRAEKNLCCPDYFEFRNDYFMYDDKYARAIFVRQLPASMSDLILTEIQSTNLELVLSLNIAPVEPEEAIKKVGRQITSIKQERLAKEKKASERGIFSDVLSDELKRSLSEAEELLSDLQSKDQKMLLVNIVVMVVAENYEELELNSEKVYGVFRKYMCTAGAAFLNQEECMASALPLGNCRLSVRRTLTTESTIAFMPFNATEMSQDKGVYYGLNQTTGNLILFNRKSLINPNGFILGSPGGGKSFFAKREIVNVFLSTDDEILIIDPEREYTKLGKALGGEVIYISENALTHFNPLEIVVTDDDTDDPIRSKYNFFLSFFETIMGGEVSPEQKTIIDNCLHKVYAEFMAGTAPMPTLEDYYNVLTEHPDPGAKTLYTSLDLYVHGSMNVFSHASNVNADNRIVIYDIKDLGKQLKPLGMMIVLENLWGKIVKNRQRGKNTWIYIDEIYLLFRSEENANFLYELYKRARKWGGVPTGITQNVEDLLRSETARAMLSNTEFVVMLRQAASDREELARLLKIPEAIMEFVVGSPAGSGLLYAGGYGCIPFRDYFPKNTELYKLMTTKFGE
ncbi:MAG: ATP-binding protein [Clostridiales bacterium]|nr:ATP-binding protein [Clostridiales bacterium]